MDLAMGAESAFGLDGMKEVALAKGSGGLLADSWESASDVVLALLGRIILELVIMDYHPRVLLAAISRVQRTAWCDISGLKRLAEFSKERAKCDVLEYDREAARERKYDCLLARTERKLRWQLGGSVAF